MTNESGTKIVCVELPTTGDTNEKWDQFQEMMDMANQESHKAITQLAYDLSVSEECATDVWYLRTRFRHTDELEAELIRLHKAGTPPNIFEFGCTEETGKALMAVVDAELEKRTMQ